QAEDGIRDLTVTGVQTCALPIYRLGELWLRAVAAQFGRHLVQARKHLSKTPRQPAVGGRQCRSGVVAGADNLVHEAAEQDRVTRSEERRVGKGGRLGGRRAMKQA